MVGLCVHCCDVSIGMSMVWVDMPACIRLCIACMYVPLKYHSKPKMGSFTHPFTKGWFTTEIQMEVPVKGAGLTSVTLCSEH